MMLVVPTARRALFLMRLRLRLRMLRLLRRTRFRTRLSLRLRLRMELLSRLLWRLRLRVEFLACLRLRLRLRVEFLACLRLRLRLRMKLLARLLLRPRVRMRLRLSLLHWRGRLLSVRVRPMRRLHWSGAAKSNPRPLLHPLMLLANLSWLPRRRMLSGRLCRAELLRIAALLRHRRVLLGPCRLMPLDRRHVGMLRTIRLSRLLTHIAQRLAAGELRRTRYTVACLHRHAVLLLAVGLRLAGAGTLTA